MKRLIFTLFGILMQTVALAQTAAPQANGSVEERSAGRVVDADGDPVAYAAVAVMNADSVIVGSEACDSTGHFSIKFSHNNDSVIIETSCFGYQKSVITAQTMPSVITLEQRMVEGAIDEVVVKGQKYSFTAVGDRYVFKISSDLDIVKSSTVFDMLKLTPMVQVDQQNNISITGANGVQMYVNGRQNRMSQDGLINYLKSMPAVELSSIDVMPVANSTYHGNGGSIILDYDITDKQTLGFVVNTYFGGNRLTSSDISRYGNLASQIMDSIYNTTVVGKNFSRAISANINY